MAQLADAQALALPGVEIAWPDGGTPLDEVGFRVNEALTSNGWCMINMPSDEAMSEGVLDQVQQLKFETPKAEFVADLLGQNGTGKVCHLSPDSGSDFLSVYDEQVTQLCASIRPFAWQTMGFNISGRTEGMVWMPHGSQRERDQMKPQQLDDEDVEDGLVASHLSFLQRRKLCCLYFLGTDGGKISLYSNGEAEPKVELDVSADQLLVFRCDQMLFQHDPDDEFTIYESWVMDDPPQLDMQGVLADPTQKCRLQGLISGVGCPLGPRVMIKSTHTCLGGSSNSTVECWNMYASGSDAQIYVPKVRFDTDIYFAKEGEEFIPGVTSYHVHGALVDDDRLLTFDNEFFDIPSEEAPFVWPKQRMLLEVGYMCLANAGWTRKTLFDKNISAYIGDCGGDWFGTNLQQGETFTSKIDETCIGGFMSNILSSRLSYAMGMRGATMAVDTACSAGLCAYACAVATLRPGKSSQFQSFSSGAPIVGNIAGGANSSSGPTVWIGNSAASMLSHEGRCFTYDQSADGYARGEGVSCIYSEPVATELLKETMEACCIGCCANQDGRSATLTAPNGPSQTACTKASLAEGGITPGEVNASECHGTGTPLGDPIEVGALIGVHGADRTNGSAFGLTSSKSNIGHGEDNAGSAGLLKCILMATYSSCAPNCHLRTMNSNLITVGFPAMFDTELIDTFLNSTVSGVSSFGMGGANAHAEIWAQSRIGPHTTKDVALGSYDQLTITCPITFGQIDHLTGEPAIDFEVEGIKKARADVLREPLADYGISRYAYSGAFRLRPLDEEDEDEDDFSLPYGETVHICGSWSGWMYTEEMERTEDGTFTTIILLGDTRCESFYLCLNGDKDSMFFPAITNASPLISVQGPGDQGNGRRWLIDGRDNEIPAGTAYKIGFKPGRNKKVWWQEVSVALAMKAQSAVISHTYSILGSWTCFQSEDLQQSPDEPGVWVGSYKISESGQDRIQLVRDRDPEQLIYPSKADADSTSIPLRGPDGWGAGKYWLIQGEPDETVELRLAVDDGHMEVTIGSKVWQNVEGWGRHDYFIMSLTSSQCAQMKMEGPGIFKYSGVISETYSDQYQGFVESFQIVVDMDPHYCFYPAMADAGGGRYICCKPDGRAHDENWLIRSLWPGKSFEVVLDLNVADSRKMVTWKLQA